MQKPPSKTSRNHHPQSYLSLSAMRCRSGWRLQDLESERSEHSPSETRHYPNRSSLPDASRLIRADDADPGMGLGVEEASLASGIAAAVTEAAGVDGSVVAGFTG